MEARREAATERAPDAALPRRSSERDRAVVVAVVAVGVVEVARDEIVGVIAVRDRLVPAIRAVVVLHRMPVVEPRGALIGVLRRHRDGVVLDLSTFLVLQMAVIEVVDVARVADRGVAARGAMDVLRVGRHRRLSE
jgi:hypothetical protein